MCLKCVYLRLCNNATDTGSIISMIHSNTFISLGSGLASVTTPIGDQIGSVLTPIGNVLDPIGQSLHQGDNPYGYRKREGNQLT